MKKFLKQVVLAPHSGWQSDHHDGTRCSLLNDSDEDLVFTVERFVDPVKELIDYAEAKLKKYESEQPSFLRNNQATTELRKLIKDARNATGDTQ